VKGIDLMKKRRPKAKNEIELANGPGKLAAAMAIGREQYGFDLTDSPLMVKVADWGKRKSIAEKFGGVVQTTRIGLGKNPGASLPYRFYLRNHPCVSIRVKEAARVAKDGSERIK
ncbi:MAG TPA: hypothetical protein ENN67_08630, partial [Firmicutes bacterium]|nr:hypothetical protein [Bacillota bacterium]